VCGDSIEKPVRGFARRSIGQVSHYSEKSSFENVVPSGGRMSFPRRARLIKSLPRLIRFITVLGEDAEGSLINGRDTF